MKDELASEPAGFRRRAIAFLIDWAICALILACCAAVLFATTNGRSQFIPDSLPFRCREIAPVPSELTLPPGFAPNQAKVCLYFVLGWPAANVLTLTESTVEGYVTTNRTVMLTIDADGMAWGGPVNSGPTEALVIVFRLLLDAYARSPGRRICGIAVVEGRTGRKASFSRLWRRYLLFSLPVGMSSLVWIPGSPQVSPFGGTGFSLGLGLVPTLISLALLVWAVVSINARRPAFYDRPVGTSVERI